MASLDFFIQKDVVVLSKDADIGEALYKIESSPLKTGVFLTDGKIIGIITESDLINAFIDGFSSGDMAFNIATKNVVSFNMWRSLEYAVDVFISKNLKRMPVVDNDGNFVGLLTQDSIIDYFERKSDRFKQKAINLISRNKVICANTSDSVRDCALLMSSNKIGFLPIFDSGNLVGSITDTDILSIMKNPADFDAPVSAFVRKDIGIVNENTNIEDILELMKQKSYSQVVVVGYGNELIGVLSKRDLTRNIKDSYQQFLEKKLKSARDSLYTLPTPIMEIEKSYGGYYVVWHNEATQEIMDVELFDFKITDIIPDATFLEAIELVDLDGKTKTTEISIGKKSFNVIISKIDENILQLVFYDITHIKKSNERLSNIIDILPQLVIVTDGKKIKSCNKSLLNFFGLSSLEEFLSLYSCICESFLPQDGFLTYDGADTWLKTAISNSANGVESLAKMFDRNRGEERIFSVKAVDLSLNGDSGALVTLFDITERHLQSELLQTQTKELEKLATTDSLTGIYNRNKLRDIAVYEFKKLKRERYPLSMILFDIDHFKKINDTFGHNTGDIILKTIASLVGGLIRESDTFVRWGGEEFIILAPGTNLDNAKILAEKIRKSIESYEFKDVNRVTCSFGVAQVNDKLDLEDLVENADKALYVAKRNGRNRVECFLD